MKSSNPLSKREWILLIVILLLVQFMVHWLSLKYGTSVSALGYVSFAGTVVSILLGLIAIIYAFVQSFTQANSVVEIREQIDKLVSAGNDIVSSKDDLHRSAVELSVITDELSVRISESILATKEVAGNVVKLSDAFASQNPSPEFPLGEPAEAGARGDVLTVFNSTRILLTIMVLTIAEGGKRGMALNQIRRQIAVPVGDKLGHQAEFMNGMFFMALFSLEAEGFVSVVAKGDDSWEMKCNEGFLEKVSVMFPRGKGKKHKEFEAFWSVVDELDDDEPLD